MKRLAQHLAAAAAATFAIACADAATWYVDASKEPGTGNGESAATAYHTMQEAIARASTTEVDTILVAPGVYSNGETRVFSTTRNGATVDGRVRVYIDRAVKLVATSNVRGETVILGSYGDVTEAGVAYDGRNGTNAQIAYSSNCVQCVTIKNGAEGTEIRGFTFRDGVIHQSLGGSSLGAGGVFRASPRLNASDFTVVNCDFVDCAGRGAGGMHGGTAVNCRFTGCWNFNHEKGGAAALQISAYNCIFSENGNRGQGGKNTPVVASAGTLVNCTLVNNYSRNGLCNFNSVASVYVNCANYDNALTFVDTTSVSTNCVHDFTSSIAVGANALDLNVYSFDSVAEVKTNLCVCPLRGDYRPVAGGRLDGTGDDDGPYMSFIPEEFRGKDFYGNDMAAGETPIGAAMPAAQVKTGAFKMSTYFDVDGRAMATYPQYVQSSVWPADMEVGVSHQRTDDAIGISWSDSYFYFGQRDTTRQLLPPASESPRGVSLMTVTETYYVGNAEGQSSASDSNAGTAAAPFETIQAAVDALPSSASETKYYRIIVRPGHYRTGGKADTSANAFNTRIVVPAGRYVHIKAEGGPENTFIHGSPDDSYLDADVNPGCGPSAYRCLYAPSSARLCVSGFTFCDSYAPTRDANATAGAAICTVSSGTDSAQKIYDCVFTGNHGPASCGSQAFFYRCLFTNNVESGSYGIAANSFLSACVFAYNNVKNEYILLGSKAHSFNCTIYEPHASTLQHTSHSVNYAINDVFAQGGYLANPTDGTMAGCVINVKSDDVTAAGNLHAEPFLGVEWGDYRAKEDSVVFGAGTMADPKGLVTDLLKMKHMRGDFYNNSLFSAAGEVTAGAVASSRAERIVYADARNGSDLTGDGLSEDTALKTLAAAVAVPCDGTIVALPGVYSEKSMACSGTAVHGGTPSLACRVIVPKNTTLVSRDGPETTVIMGAASSDASADAKELGRGPDAVRCVFLETGAVLRGFTVTGGRTAVKDDGYIDDAFGGGVLGRSISGTLVENCIVSNNAASCGGGGAYTRFRNCRIEGNKAGYFGSVARHVSLYGCYMADNRGSNPIDVYYDVVNCTYGEGNANISGSAAHMLSNGASSSRVWNCVGLSDVSANTMTQTKPDYRNCLFPKESKYNLGSNTDKVNFDYTLAELRAMFSGGVPASRAAAAVDAGTADAIALLAVDADLAGGARVMNGAIDIGAYEYSWLSDYSAAIPRKLEVVKASSGVTLSGGRVTLMDGDEVVASALASDRRSISAELSGEGVLTVYRNGELLGELSATGTLRFGECAAGDVFSFAYASASGGSAAITACRSDAGLILLVQ